MAITFQSESSLGDGSFIRVRRGGLPHGKIFHTTEIYRFYEGDGPKLGGADLQDGDLERLKATILSRYGTT